MKKIHIRPAVKEDAKALLEVYAPFVISEDRNLSDVSFEYEVPSEEEFKGRIENISAKYPYLVCEVEGKIAGYVYAHEYIPRAAYQWGAEVTIYLGPVLQGLGAGRVLYEALEELLRMQGVLTTYACVTASNAHSVGLHEAMGYKIVGRFNQCGFKHGHWLDMVWLEKQIMGRPLTPPPLMSWHDMEEREVNAVLNRANKKLNKIWAEKHPR